MAKPPAKILLVEDDTSIRELYAEILREEGFAVTTVVDGVEAENLLQNESFDLTLLDILLPEKDGFALLDESAGTVVRDNMGIVLLLTNLAQNGTIKKGYESGAEGYLIKSSLNPGEVVQEVKTFLSRYRDKSS